MPKCRECGAPIKFVKAITTGRLIPVDAVPDEGGNVIARRGPDSKLVGRALTKDERVAEGVLVFMPHHATCEVQARRKARARQQAGPKAVQEQLF